MTRDEVLKRILKMKPKQRKTMKPVPPKAVNPLDKIMDEDRVGYLISCYDYRVIWRF